MSVFYAECVNNGFVDVNTSVRDCYNLVRKDFVACGGIYFDWPKFP